MSNCRSDTGFSNATLACNKKYFLLKDTNPAKKLGVPLEEYAKQLELTKEV